jgi:hypothetical protein
MDNTTQIALNKLTERQRHYCRNLSVIINKCRHSDKTLTFFATCGKLEGYLDSLMDSEITKEDWKILLHYYETADRSVEG